MLIFFDFLYNEDNHIMSKFFNSNAFAWFLLSAIFFFIFLFVKQISDDLEDSSYNRGGREIISLTELLEKANFMYHKDSVGYSPDKINNFMTLSSLINSSRNFSLSKNNDNVGFQLTFEKNNGKLSLISSNYIKISCQSIVNMVSKKALSDKKFQSQLPDLSKYNIILNQKPLNTNSSCSDSNTLEISYK